MADSLNLQQPYYGTIPTTPSTTTSPLRNSYTQSQQYFMQPQGNIYMINNSSEVGIVPVGGNGLSAAICLTEGILFLKTIQNGMPMMLSYRLNTLDNQSNTQVASINTQPQKADETSKTEEQNKKILEKMQQYESRIEKLEEQLKNKDKKGGNSEWPL